MYALCTGRPPFRAETSYGTLQRICEGQPRDIRDSNPEIPEWLVAFVWRLHAQDWSDRFQTAAESGELLEQCVQICGNPLRCRCPMPSANWLCKDFPNPQCASPGFLAEPHATCVVPLRFYHSFRWEQPFLAWPAPWLWSSAWWACIGEPIPNPRFPWEHRRQPRCTSAEARRPTQKRAIVRRPGEQRMLLPDWDDDIARQVVDLQAEVERLEHRVAELEAGPEPQSPLPSGRGPG